MLWHCPSYPQDDELLYALGWNLWNCSGDRKRWAQCVQKKVFGQPGKGHLKDLQKGQKDHEELPNSNERLKYKKTLF